MIKLGLIGYPLGHSLSPLMHKAAFSDAGISGSYELLEVAPDKLKDMVEFLKDNDFRGFNATIPHKVAIMEFLDQIDPLALKVGAVNTVLIEQNKTLIGYNTDVYGFMYAIPEEIRQNFTGKTATLIGSGGAARAITTGMAEMGISEIQIVTLASEMNKAEEIKNIMQKNYNNIIVNCQKLENNIDLSGNALIVNATPVGMEGKFEGQSPLSQFTLDSLSKNTFVYDIVYKPRKTKLLDMAEQKGMPILSGLDMLVLQGAKAFNIWTNCEPNVKVMRDAINV